MAIQATVYSADLHLAAAWKGGFEVRWVVREVSGQTEREREREKHAVKEYSTAFCLLKWYMISLLQRKGNSGFYSMYKHVI